MLYKNFQKVLHDCEQSGFPFDTLSLSKGALFHLYRRLLNGSKVLELGGGQSTVFWYFLNQSNLLNVNVTTILHDMERASKIKEIVSADPNIVLKVDVLKQISDKEWELIFESTEKWDQIGEYLPIGRYNEYSIRNTFYANLPNEQFDEKSIDVLIVDGPHGNGRSLSFPLLKRFLKEDAYILIDDYHHYPFLQDASKVFDYEVIYKEAIGEQKWALIRLK